VSFPCPCCGYLVFGEGPGSYDICDICFWEDDNVQLRWPLLDGGANKVSLAQAQRNYVDIGTSEERLRRHVRPPRPDERVDPGWRPIDLNIDQFEQYTAGADVRRRPWPEDYTTLYWWRPTFWLSGPTSP
jgi:hypothetical protein